MFFEQARYQREFWNEKEESVYGSK